MIPGIVAHRKKKPIPSWTGAAISVPTAAGGSLVSRTPYDVADSYVGTFSVWLKRNETAAGYQLVAVNRRGDNSNIVLLCQSYSSGSDLIMYVRKSDNSGYSAAGRLPWSTSDTTYWHHFIWSWDLSSTSPAPRMMGYVDDSAASYSNTQTVYSSSVVWSNAGFTQLPTGSAQTESISVMDYYLTNEFIDLTVEANRRKFYSAGGCPVNLGDDGSTPTGNRPLVYFSGAASVWNEGVNRGTQTGFYFSGTAFTDTTKKC